jgi:hypothetical protein
MRTAWSDMRNRLIAGADKSDNFDVEHKLSTQSVNVVICAALRCTMRLELAQPDRQDSAHGPAGSYRLDGAHVLLALAHSKERMNESIQATLLCE